MDHGVLDQRLQEERRDRGLLHLGHDAVVHRQAIAETALLDAQIAGHQIELALQRRLLTRRVRE